MMTPFTHRSMSPNPVRCEPRVVLIQFREESERCLKKARRILNKEVLSRPRPNDSSCHLIAVMAADYRSFLVHISTVIPPIGIVLMHQQINVVAYSFDMAIAKGHMKDPRMGGTEFEPPTTAG